MNLMEWLAARGYKVKNHRDGVSFTVLDSRDTYVAHFTPDSFDKMTVDEAEDHVKEIVLKHHEQKAN